MHGPLIGITCDNKDNTVDSRRYESAIAYSRAIVAAGGLPVLLPHEPALAADYVERCDGLLFSGGGDIRMERFGETMHQRAQPVDARRQEFELALLDALEKQREKPVLGVCLGMQIMALHAGGKLNQHLADTLGETGAAVHQKDNRHPIVLVVPDSPLVLSSKSEIPNPKSEILLVPSWHHQAVATPGSLRVVATAPDGVIEAIDDPGKPFYAGVQWHPERGGEGHLNSEILRRFVDAAHRTRE